MADPLPLAVLVSGAPGAGKTTLAASLGQRLRVPVVHKDRLREGVLFTVGRHRWNDRQVFGPELFYKSMEAWLGMGMSVIGDMTFYPGVSEPDVRARLHPLAELVNVHCIASNAVERFRQRGLADPIWPAGRVDELLDEVNRLEEQLREPLDFGCPTIVVDTTEDYRPGLEAVAATIEETYNLATTGAATTPPGRTESMPR